MGAKPSNPPLVTPMRVPCTYVYHDNLTNRDANGWSFSVVSEFLFFVPQNIKNDYLVTKSNVELRFFICIINSCNLINTQWKRVTLLRPSSKNVCLNFGYFFWKLFQLIVYLYFENNWKVYLWTFWTINIILFFMGKKPFWYYLWLSGRNRLVNLRSNTFYPLKLETSKHTTGSNDNTTINSKKYL
jgi:hypothetical protein